MSARARDVGAAAEAQQAEGAAGTRPQCACGDCEQCQAKKRLVQRSPLDGGTVPGGERATSALTPVQAALSSPGRPLDTSMRSFFEGRFHHDFSNVRLHTDGAAAAAASALSARAFTVQRDVVLGDGQYSPGSIEGQQLLAHELTHVVQQSAARAEPDAALELSRPGDASEVEAEQSAMRVLGGAPLSASPIGRRTGVQLARAEFEVGKEKIQIDYGAVAALPVENFQSEIEARFTAWASAPATPLQAGLGKLGPRKLEWVLFAQDLLIHNPVAGLDATVALTALIDHAPLAQSVARGRKAGDFSFENEVLMVSGWFEKGLSKALKAPTGTDLTKVRGLINKGTQATASDACPSPRPAFDEPKLRSALPPLAESRIKAEVPPASKNSTSLATAQPMADAVQAAAHEFFAPYADHARGKGNLTLEKWSYSANLVPSNSPAAAPTEDKRRAYIENRAILAGSSLLESTHFDSRCDQPVMDDIVEKLDTKAGMQTIVESVLAQLSYTVQSADPKQVVMNLNSSLADACDARWRLVETMCHELTHVMASDAFRAKATRRQILVEGFTEILGDQLYRHITAEATKSSAERKKYEAGMGVVYCVPIPSPDQGYGEAAANADKVRTTVGDARFRAAYFLGQVELVGIQPRRFTEAQGDPLEREALAEERAAGGPPAARHDVAPRGSTSPVYAAHAASPLQSTLIQQLGSGRPLEAAARQRAEAQLGCDFSNVRVHTDTRSAESARGMRARAYTVGEDIVFGGGEYAPAQSEGVRLLTHELTHVAQFRGGAARGDRVQRRAEDDVGATPQAGGGAPQATARIDDNANDQERWRKRVDAAVRKQFGLGGAGLTAGRVQFLEQKQFAAQFPAAELADKLLAIFLGNHDMNEQPHQILDHNHEIPSIDRLKPFIQAGIARGYFEGQTREYDVTTGKPFPVFRVTPRELVTQYIAGFADVAGPRANRSVVVQAGGTVHTLVHEACHFYSHSDFKAMVSARTDGDDSMGNARISQIFQEGLAEHFAYEVMSANQADFGPPSVAYPGELTQATRLVMTLGMQAVQRAYFDGDRIQIERLGIAMDLYKQTPVELDLIESLVDAERAQRASATRPRSGSKP